jgi:ribosomal subunit interface protein
MNYPLQTTYRGIPQSPELDSHIREKAEKLGLFFDHIKSCHVIVEIPHKHHHQGKQFNVRIDIGVPGYEIVVDRDHSDDVYIALRNAFDAAKRQLEDHVLKIRGQIKTHENRRGQQISETEIDEPGSE